MAIKTCPECGTKVEDSLTCPNCGFSFKRKVNMANVNASLDAIRRYDAKFNGIWLLFIPSLICIILGLFLNFIFLIVALIFPIAIVFLQARKLMKRQEFILSVCKDRYSIISFIKEQNQNATSVTQDNSKLLALACAMALTCENNATAKQFAKKFALANSYTFPGLFMMLIFAGVMSLENCENLNLPTMGQPGPISVLFLAVGVVSIIMLIVCGTLQKKYDK